MPDRTSKRAFELVLEMWSRRKGLAVMVFLLVFAAVAGIVKFLPDLYQSTAVVLVERQQVPETFVRSSITGELETRLHTISQEILSRARLEDLIARFDLYPDLRTGGSKDVVVERMRRDIKLELKGVEQASGRGATVSFKLSFRGRDPETVARVTNTLASFYVAENVRLREQQASNTAEFLRLQLADMKKRLAEQEERVKAYRARHVGELPQQQAVNLATIERLHAQLHLNSANQLRALDRRAALARRVAEANPGAAELAPDVATSQIARLRRELSDLRRQFSDKYPDVIRIKAELAALERDLVDPKPDGGKGTEQAVPPAPAGRRPEIGLREADAEMEALKGEEQRLRREIVVYQRRIENAPQREQEFQELARDYETTRELHASLLKRYEDAQLAENMEQLQKGEFRILDPALPAKQPAAPNRLRLLLMGLLLSLGVAAGVVALVEHVDTSFHTADDLRALRQVSVLVSIPSIVTAGDRRRRAWRFAFTAVAVALAVALVIRASQYVADGNEFLLGLLVRGGGA